MLLALEKSTPVSTSSCLPGSLIPQECSQRANNGRFTLRDLLMVPMQRVLKYHLLLQVHSWGPPRSKDYGLGISTSLCHRSGGGTLCEGPWAHAWPPDGRRRDSKRRRRSWGRGWFVRPGRRGQAQVMSASVGHAGAGETHAGRNGEGESAAGPGCHEGEWSHTGVSVRHIQDSTAQRHPDTVTSMDSTPPPSPHHRATWLYDRLFTASS